MLHRNLNTLDENYITLNSKYRFSGDDKLYLKEIENLAQSGQINAIQDYYRLKSEDMNNEQIEERIDEIMFKMLNSEFIDFEEVYALYLTNRNNMNGSDVILSCMEALNFTFNTDNNIEMNRMQFAVVGERVAEILKNLEASYTNKNFENIGKNSKEELIKSYHRYKNTDLEDLVGYCVSTSKLRDGKDLRFCYQQLGYLSRRKLHEIVSEQ